MGCGHSPRPRAAAQSLICIPVDETVPRTCGYPDDPIRFRVTEVPEPGTVALFALGLAGLVVARRVRPKIRAATMAPCSSTNPCKKTA